MNLALKKPWLREPAAKALCTLITVLPDTDSKRIKACAEHISKSLEKGGLVQSQDGAAVILTLRSLPSTVRPKISAKIWQHADPLHPANLSLLSKVLREVQSDETSVKATGAFKSEPHFIWALILRRYVDKAKDTVAFKSLWETVVESTHHHATVLIVDGLFSGDPSLERKYLGYQLFLAFLPQLPEDLVGDLFTPNFLRSLVNNAASGDRYLNKAAKKSVLLPASSLTLALNHSLNM
jgi:DNA polymerase phi